MSKIPAPGSWEAQRELLEMGRLKDIPQGWSDGTFSGKHVLMSTVPHDLRALWESVGQMLSPSN